MGKSRYLFAVLIVFFILYFFLFPFTVKEEFVLVPEKGTTLVNAAPGQGDISGNWPFASFGRMGYYDREKREFSLLDGRGRSRISDNFYIEDQGDVLNLVSRSGELSTEIDTSLVPAFFGEHIFLTGCSQGYLREIDGDGRILWEYYMPSVITCLDNKNGITAAGLLNGDIVLLDGGGELVDTLSPGGSRVDIIYGISLSRTGDRLAVVSGLDPQRFILIEKKENGYRPVYHENLTQSFRRPLSLVFDDSSHLIIEGERKGLYYSPGSPALSEFDLPGEFHDGKSSPGDGTLYFQSETEGGTVLTLYTAEGEKVLENRFGGRPGGIDIRDNRILLAGDGGVYVLRREFY